MTKQKSLLELREHLKELEQDLKQADQELYYLHEFISFYKLDDDYRHFIENAHEEWNDDSPFPSLIL